MTATVAMTLRPLGLDPLDGLNKVVTKVECRFVATDDDGGYDDAVFDVVPLGSPNPAAFTPFDEAKDDYDLLLSWVQSAKGDGYATWKADLEAAAIARLTAPKPFSGAAVEAPAS